jgi:hypothetical protein
MVVAGLLTTRDLVLCADPPLVLQVASVKWALFVLLAAVAVAAEEPVVDAAAAAITEYVATAQYPPF